MRKLLNLVALAIVAVVVGGYFTVGPSFFLGGPKSSDIVAVSRAAMISSASGEEDVAKARAAEISPKGICSRTDAGSYACAVEVTVAGAAPQVFVSVLKKATDGSWAPGE